MLATVHVPLSAVPGLLTRERVETVLDLGGSPSAAGSGWPRPASRWPASTRTPAKGACSGPRIATCWPPPRQGPRRRGIDVAGPLPADDPCSGRPSRGRFDAVVACYHDQGLIPVKLAAFGEAGQRDAWLPIIRTSVDHGTAFDIAGRGRRGFPPAW